MTFPLYFQTLHGLGPRVFFMLKGYNFVGYLVIVYVPYKAKAFCKIVNLIFLFCGQFVISRVQELFKLWGGAG